jgi:hypothetical protein
MFTKFMMDGFKTYIVGVAMIAVGIYMENETLILEGAAIMSLRRAISTK